MQNKKATWTLGEILYWAAYLPLTAAVILAIVLIPSRMLDAAVQPYWLDAANTEERIYTMLDEYDPVYGSRPGVLADFNEICQNNTIKLSMSQKAFAFRIYIDGKECYGNKQFYKDAKPLAPVRYELFTSNKTYQTSTGPVTVKIEQVWPPTYESIT